MISIASDFSPFPGGRYLTDGPFNGELFRDKFLIPALERDVSVTVNLDEARGYPVSFLEEAFGGLVRKGYKPEELRRRLHIVASSPRFQSYISMIWDYIDQAATPMAHAG